MRKYLPSILLASTLLIGEIHTFWEKKPLRYENWIIDRYVPMTIQWNVKLALDELVIILYFISAWYFAKYPNRANKITISIFIFLAIADALMYFWNYKTYDYHIVYLCAAVVWAASFFFGIRIAAWGKGILKSIKRRLIG